MIHGSSNDPILIRKIALKIWSLRDELEAVIKERVALDPTLEISIQDLLQEYAGATENEDGGNVLELVDDSEEGMTDDEDLDDSEDAMAAAMNDDGDDDAEVSEDADLDDSEDAMAAAMGGGDDESASDSGEVLIKQRIPEIPSEKLGKGKTLLNEINMNEMFFFGSKNFLQGQSIVIEFLVPKKFIINADVVYCRPYNLKSRVISENRLPYRTAVQFTFLKPGERTLLRQFCQSIEPDVQEKVATKAPKEDAGDMLDEFDELDDF
jgi:hypothetical protein